MPIADRFGSPVHAKIGIGEHTRRRFWLQRRGQADVDSPMRMRKALWTTRARRRAPTNPLRQSACLLSLAAVFVALTALGCTTLSGVDRKANSLLRTYSQRLDGGAVAPVETYRDDADDYRSQTQLDEYVDTLNPPATKLDYSAADPERDVAEILRSYAEVDPDALQLSLQEAFRIAQESARQYRTAEEEYVLAALRLLIQEHRFSPRLFNDISASIDGSADTSATDTVVQVMNELRVTQMLPYGGDVEASLIWDATEQLREEVTGEYRSATQLALSANIPLLRDAGSIAKEDLIQARRDLVYAARAFERFRREFLLQVADDYFDLVVQRANIVNQERSLESRRFSLERAEARVEAGRQAAFQARRINQGLLQVENNLARSRERFILSLDRFKVLLGIPVERDVVIAPVQMELPEPKIAPAQAGMLALQYRLDLQTERDRIDDSRRDVANAKNQTLPDLDLSAGVNVASASGDDAGNFDFDFKDTDYTASVTFGLPLDREIERLNFRSAIIDLQRSQRGFRQFRDNVVVSARQSVRNVDLARFSLQLAQERVEIQELALEQQKLEEADAFALTETEDDLLEAQNDRDAALSDLRLAVLQYLLETGQLRVTRDGTLMPPPGMEQAHQRQGGAGGKSQGRLDDKAVGQGRTPQAGQPAVSPTGEQTTATDAAGA